MYIKKQQQKKWNMMISRKINKQKRINSDLKHTLLRSIEEFKTETTQIKKHAIIRDKPSLPQIHAWNKHKFTAEREIGPSRSKNGGLSLSRRVVKKREWSFVMERERNSKNEWKGSVFISGVTWHFSSI